MRTHKNKHTHLPHTTQAHTYNVRARSMPTHNTLTQCCKILASKTKNKTTKKIKQNEIKKLITNKKVQTHERKHAHLPHTTQAHTYNVRTTHSHNVAKSWHQKQKQNHEKIYKTK